MVHLQERTFTPSIADREDDRFLESAAEETDSLRAIVEGTAESTGEAFFHSLVEHLAAAIGVQYAFVAEFAAVE